MKAGWFFSGGKHCHLLQSELDRQKKNTSGNQEIAALEEIRYSALKFLDCKMAIRGSKEPHVVSVVLKMEKIELRHGDVDVHRGKLTRNIADLMNIKQGQLVVGT